MLLDDFPLEISAGCKPKCEFPSTSDTDRDLILSNFSFSPSSKATSCENNSEPDENQIGSEIGLTPTWDLEPRLPHFHTQPPTGRPLPSSLPETVGQSSW